MTDTLPVLILALTVLVGAVFLILMLYLFPMTAKPEKLKRKRKNDEIDPVCQATGLKGGYVVAGEIQIPFGDERRRVLAMMRERRDQELESQRQMRDEAMRLSAKMHEEALEAYRQRRDTMEQFRAAHVSDSVPDEHPIPFPTKRMK